MSLSLEAVDVEIVEARNLLAADKGGTSDPFAQVVLLDHEQNAIPKETYRTKAWKRTLFPQWEETFKLGDDTLPSVIVGSYIEVRVYDEDKGLGSSNDPLGIVNFPVKLLAKKNKLRCDAWFPLISTPAMTKADMMASGEVRLRCKLIGDTPAIFAELKEEASQLSHEGMIDARTEESVDEAHAKLYADKKPNELHIQLLKAHDLPVMDKAMLVGKGSGDPFVKFECLGATANSTTKKKSLNPEWNESFVLPVDDPAAVLEVWMYDYDLASAPDFMGCVQIPLDSCLDKLRHSSKLTLLDEQGVALPPSTSIIKKKDNNNTSSRPVSPSIPPLPSIEITLWWKYNPDLEDLLDMDLSDELKDEEIELKARKEDAIKRKEQLKQLKVIELQQAKEEFNRILLENKHQQYLDEMSTLQDEYAELLEEMKLNRIIQWEELNQLEPGEAYDNDKLDQRSKEPGYVSWEDFEIQYPPPPLTYSATTATVDDDGSRYGGKLILKDENGNNYEIPKEISFEEWNEQNELKELELYLKQTGVIDQSPVEFVTLYRESMNQPNASISDIITLVKNDVVESKEEEQKLQLLEQKDNEDVKKDKDDKNNNGGEDDDDDEKNNNNDNNILIKDIEGDVEGEEDDDEFKDLKDFSINDISNDRIPNELCVCVVRGRGLLPVDRTITGNATSDPLVTIHMENSNSPPISTHCCNKNLNPLWKEILRIPLPIDFVNPSPVSRHDSTALSSSAISSGGEGDDGHNNNNNNDDDDGKKLLLFVEDKNLVGANEFMGKVEIPLTKLSPFWSPPMWYKLDPDTDDGDGGGTGNKKGNMSKTRRASLNKILYNNGMKKWEPFGAIEIRLRYRFNPKYVEVPLIPEVTKYETLNDEDYNMTPSTSLQKEPNRLLITLWRGRNLPIMDRNIIGSSGSSDPLVRFKLIDEYAESTVKKKTLTPEWGESWKLNAESQDGILEVLLEDQDTVSQNDFMGKLSIPLTKYKNKGVVRSWFHLCDKKGGRGNRGDLDIQLRWYYDSQCSIPEDFLMLDPGSLLKPPKGETQTNLGKTRNELLVTIVRCKYLLGKEPQSISYAINAKGKEYGASSGSNDMNNKFNGFDSMKVKTINPQVKLNISDGGDEAFTSVKTNEFAPVWIETMKLSCPEDPGATLTLRVQDSPSTSDDKKTKNNKKPVLIGKVNIALEPLKAGHPIRSWYTLGNEKTGYPDGVKMRGSIEVCLRWRHNPQYAEGEPLEESEIDDYPLHKIPNELRVGVIRARKLQIIEKQSGGLFSRKGGGLGSSGGGDSNNKSIAGDPFITVTVIGAGGKSVISPVKKKTINPRWNWRCCLPATPLLIVDDKKKNKQISEDGEGDEDGEDRLVASSGGGDKSQAVVAMKSKKASSSLKKKGKNNKQLITQEMSEPIDEKPGLYLEIVVSNYKDNKEKEKENRHVFLGRAFVYIEKVEDLRNKKPIRVWYPLAPQPKGRYLKPDAERYGEVELLLKWVYNPQLDFSDLEKPYLMTQDPFQLMKPNELNVAVLSSSGLNVKDKNMFDTSCKSDLRVLLRAGSSNIIESSTKIHEFDPTWNERFVVNADELTTTLEVLIEDTYVEGSSRLPSRSGSRQSSRVSSRPESRTSSRPGSALLSSNTKNNNINNNQLVGMGNPIQINSNTKIIGRCIINLKLFLDKQPRRTWIELVDENGNNNCGKIEIIIKWQFNPSLKFKDLKLDPEESEDNIDEYEYKDIKKYGNRFPNELHAIVIRTNSLKNKSSLSLNNEAASQDKDKDKGKEDKGNKIHPFVRLTLPGQRGGTVTIGSTMVLNHNKDPNNTEHVWCERFVSQELAYAPKHLLRAEVIERDAVGTTSSEVLPGDRLIGVTEVPLASLVDRMPKRSWFRLSDIKGAKSAALARFAELDALEDVEEVNHNMKSVGVGGGRGEGDNNVEASLDKILSAHTPTSSPPAVSITSDYDTSPDCGRLELWLRYAYNPEYDPNWVPQPIMVDMPTCTSTDLPPLDAFGRPPPQFTTTDLSPMTLNMSLPNVPSLSGFGNLSSIDMDRKHQMSRMNHHEDGPGGIETPRWFFLETPRINEDEIDMFDDDIGSGSGGLGDSTMVMDPIPHGPYNELGLKELFDMRIIHNNSRVWTEGMGSNWSAIDDIPVLKRKLWAYPDPPQQSQLIANNAIATKEHNKMNLNLNKKEHGHNNIDIDDEDYDEVANERWFFVADSKDKSGKPSIIGPETAESLRARFEENGSAGGLGGPRIYDGTLAWREGLADWLPLSDLPKEEGIGRNAGWKPRREQNGIPLPRFDLSMECCKCGGVAELHCLEALAMNKDHDENGENGNGENNGDNMNVVDDDDEDEEEEDEEDDDDEDLNGIKRKKKKKGNQYHFRNLPPSGRVAQGSDIEGISYEILPDFIWIGGDISATKNYLNTTDLTHVINCTEDLEDCLLHRDLTTPLDFVAPSQVSQAAIVSNNQAALLQNDDDHHHHHHHHHHNDNNPTNQLMNKTSSICYFRLPIPDLQQTFEDKYGEGMWLDAADWDYFAIQKNKIKGGEEEEGEEVGEDNSQIIDQDKGFETKDETKDETKISDNSLASTEKGNVNVASVSLGLKNLLPQKNNDKDNGEVVDDDDDDENDDDDDGEELEIWNAIKTDRREFGPDSHFWLKMFDQSYNFIESAEHINGNKTRILIHSKRGTFRSCIILISFIIRKYGLTCAESINIISESNPNMDGAEVISKFAYHGIKSLSGLLTHAASSALFAYEKKYTIGRLFCETCFDEFRFGEEDTALSMVADAAARRLLNGDRNFIDLDLRGEPLLHHQNQNQNDSSNQNDPFSQSNANSNSIVEILSTAIKKTSCLLIKLNLSGCQLGDIGIAILCKGIRFTQTIEISCLQYNNIGDLGIKHLSELIAGKDETNNSNNLIENDDDDDDENIFNFENSNNSKSKSKSKNRKDGNNTPNKNKNKRDKSKSRGGKTSHGGRGGISKAYGHPMAFLDLGFNNITHIGASYLASSLRTNETLTSLHLNSNSLNDLGGYNLGKALCDPEYEIFEESVILGAAAAENAKNIDGKTEEESVIISKQKQSEYLRLHRRNNGLTHLNLCSNQLGQKTTEILTLALSVHQTLSILELSFNPDLGNTEIKKLTNMIRISKPPLEYISLGQMVLGDDITGIIGKILNPKLDAEIEYEILKKTRLEELEVEKKENKKLQLKKQLELVAGSIDIKTNDNDEISNYTTSALGSHRNIILPKFTWKPCVLKQLHLPRNRLLSTSAYKLSNALKVNNSLLILSIPQNPIGAKGSQYIGEMLKVNKSLIKLDLEGCGLNEASGEYLGEALEINKTLTSLELSENHISGHGIQKLCKCFNKNKTLLKLNIHNVRAGIIGADHLAKSLLLKNTCNLTHLGFSNNHIKNLGAQSLAPALSSNIKLKYVDLGFNKFDITGGTFIINALSESTEPGCDIEHKTLSLHLILNGNDGCDQLVSPYLARAKIRWDFLSSTKKSKLASDTGSYPLAKSFIDPKVKAAYNSNNNSSSFQGLY